MADPAEVAIESALLNRLNALVLAPVVRVAQPNVDFAPPAAVAGTHWMQASFRPADSFALGIAFDAYVQHYGFLWVNVFGILGAGDYPARRIATAVASWFKRGTQVTKDGFVATVFEQPAVRGGSPDPGGVWWMVPVVIPYKCFARPT